MRSIKSCSQEALRLSKDRWIQMNRAFVTANAFFSAFLYHVMLRGINQQVIFEDHEDYVRFIDTLRYGKDAKRSLYQRAEDKWVIDQTGKPTDGNKQRRC